MHNAYSSLIKKHEDWYVGFCPEVPGANGQGRTIEECRKNLAQAIALILLVQQEDALKATAKTVLHPNPTECLGVNSINIDSMSVDVQW